MTRNPVRNLWAAFVSAFLTLCTSLGLITTTAVATAVAAVPEAPAARNLNTPQNTTAQEEPIRVRARADSLPPTMKQRIHAEAHGSSPSCRHRQRTDTVAPDTAAPQDTTASQHSAPAPGAVRTTTDIMADTTAKTAVDTATAAAVHGGGMTPVAPAAEPGGELPARTPAATCSPALPAADATPVTAVTPARADAPAALLLPSQSSAPAPAQPPAPASASVSDPARVLAGAGTAARG
ncbi:hypothetical protein QFZ75_003913 [Streptomyces sp. V3I8]|uniref:DUF6344 domain-containing protein n=1 Tax=Streptomyces sp. V3I8 TaxID=3042279 RepID=UPI0027813C30|nr:DUF6344 domain-containing protein [Streptomyces sp. V3I8]MDQ1037497.1 hypothetical protein [Streptomyces sp. V3I8]